MCDMTHSYVWHDSFIRVTWLIRTCDTTHSSPKVAASEGLWLIHMCVMAHGCVTKLIQTCDVTWLVDIWATKVGGKLRFYDWFQFVTRLIDMCDMTHACVWHDSWVRETWLVEMCDMTDSCIYERHTDDMMEVLEMFEHIHFYMDVVYMWIYIYICICVCLYIHVHVQRRGCVTKTKTFLPAPHRALAWTWWSGRSVY